MSIAYRVDPFPDSGEFNVLWHRAWGTPPAHDIVQVLEMSLAHLCAYSGERLVGFVNVVWDGGIHAFIVDTCVDPDFRLRGIGSRLVRDGANVARQRGAHWLHVDFAPRLEGFYRACGFAPTRAGLIDLRS